jgi:hypothetical protein
MDMGLVIFVGFRLVKTSSIKALLSIRRYKADSANGSKKTIKLGILNKPFEIFLSFKKNGSVRIIGCLNEKNNPRKKYEIFDIFFLVM